MTLAGRSLALDASKKTAAVQEIRCEGVGMGKKAETEAVVLRTSLSVKMLGFEREGAAIQGYKK